MKIASVTGNGSRALRPQGFDLSKPEVDFPTEKAAAAVFVGSQLIDQASVREQRHVRAMLHHTPALPREPHVKVQKPWSMGECSNCMTFHRYSMLVDLVVEDLAQGDGVDGVILGRRTLGMICVQVRRRRR